MSETTDRVHENPTHREIEQEHRMLREILGRLVAADEIAHIHPLLAELRALLVSHFAREEAEDGFYRVVEESGPHLLTQVQVVLDEHPVFLADVDRLLGDVDACVKGPVAKIRKGIESLAEDLHSHEAKENELMGDAFYTDLGGGS